MRGASILSVVLLFSGCGGDGGRLPNQPSSSPVITSVNVAPDVPVDAYVHGFDVTVEATDPNGIARAGMRVTGAHVQTDSVLFRPYSTQIKRTFIVQPTSTVRFGVPMNVEVTVTDSAGASATRSLTFTAYERVAPVAQVFAPTFHQDSSFEPGDRVTVRVSATDNDRLAWVGLQERGGVRLDSVSVSATAGEFNGSLTVTMERMLVHPHIEGWARDRSGNSSLTAPLTLDFRRWRTRTAMRYDRPAPVVAMVFDEKRRRIYTSTVEPGADDELNSSVEAFDLDQRLFLPPLLKNTRVLSLDLTPSGDSLVLALSNRQAIGIVDLTNPAAPLSTISLAGIGNSAMGPRSLSVDSSGKVLTTFVHDGGGLIGSVDLRTRALSFSHDITAQDLIPPETSVHVAGDRRTLFALLPTGLGGRAFLWSGGAFAQGANVPGVVGSHISWNSDGSTLLIGRAVYTRALTLKQELRVPEWGFYWQPSLMIAQGTEAVFGTWYGFARIRTDDNELIEQVRLPGEIHLCIPIESARKLACAGHYRVQSQAYEAFLIIDLY